ncbi:MAG: phosphoglycerol geranylgeranyltransferase [Thermoplasmatota archaeon]
MREPQSRTHRPSTEAPPSRSESGFGATPTAGHSSAAPAAADGSSHPSRETHGPGDKVWREIERLLEGGPIHMTLLDPASCGDDRGAKVAREAASAGTHAFMVGGSTNVTGRNLDDLVLTIKETSRLPVIYFPSTAGAFSTRVDAVYFLSVLNSRDPFFVVGEQSRGAPLLRSLGIETIGMGYIIVDPGMTVGVVSQADVITRDAHGIERAMGYALAAQSFGMRLVYLEAGSGSPQPVPVQMARTVAEALDIPLVVGGGIRTAEQARGLLDAGAQILVTGTIAERGDFAALHDIVRAVSDRRKS